MTKHPSTFAAAALAAAFAWTPSRAESQDERIEASARKSYVFQNYLRGDSIDVESEQGVVTLQGTVSDESHRSLAEQTVAGLPGVARVDNQLKVKGASSDKTSDAWITAKVKTALLFHRNVSGTGTKVQTRDGVVTLRGQAESEAQKELTTEYAKDIEGVRDAVNEMTVKPSRGDRRGERSFGDKIDDASITAQVKTTLLFHRETSGLGTEVDTKDGVVTVTGKVRSEAEKDLVTKVVSDVKGVRKVVNEVVVAP